MGALLYVPLPNMLRWLLVFALALGLGLVRGQEAEIDLSGTAAHSQPEGHTGLDVDYNRIEEILAAGQPADVDELRREVDEMKTIIYKLVMLQTTETQAAAVADTVPKAAPQEPFFDCTHWLGCKDCVSHGCAWCLAGRTCKEDVAWNCQGDVDHVGLSGIGKHTTCPVAEPRASVAAIDLSPESTVPFGSKKRSKTNSTTNPDQDTTEGDESDEDSEAEGSEEGYAYTKEHHLAELQRRAALAADTPPRGASHPYETLNTTVAASSAEIRKLYRKLSLLFHPDKNTESSVSALAHAAFTDITRAFEILGTPEKR